MQQSNESRWGPLRNWQPHATGEKPCIARASGPVSDEFPDVLFCFLREQQALPGIWPWCPDHCICFSFPILHFLAPSLPPFIFLCLSLLIHLGQCFAVVSLREFSPLLLSKFLPWQHKFSEYFGGTAALTLLTLIGSPTLSSGWHIQ